MKRQFLIKVQATCLLRSSALFKRFSTVIIVFSTVFLKPWSKIGEPKRDKPSGSQILMPGAKF
jgi:hypothetical protein